MLCCKAVSRQICSAVLQLPAKPHRCSPLDSEPSSCKRLSWHRNSKLSHCCHCLLHRDSVKSNRSAPGLQRLGLWEFCWWDEKNKSR